MNECDNQHMRGLRQRRRCGNALGRALGIQSAKAGPLDGQPPNGDVVLLGYGARCDTMRCRVKQNGERPVRLARPLLDRLPRTMRHLACAQHFVVVFGLRHERDRGAYAAFFAFSRLMDTWGRNRQHRALGEHLMSGERGQLICKHLIGGHLDVAALVFRLQVQLRLKHRFEALVIRLGGSAAGPFYWARC